MKIAKKLLALLAVFAVLVSAHGARADEDFRQVWRDTEGQIVHNTTGNCVRSIWVTNEDACEGNGLEEAERTVYFAFDKYDLSPEVREKLDSLTQKVMADDHIKGAHIIGYADRIGTASYNLKLSKKRAEMVRHYLIAAGLLKPTNTEMRWVGKSEPSAQCGNDLPRSQLLECLAPDRKVSVDVEYNWYQPDKPVRQSKPAK